jgi:hypothetical protein
MQVNHIKIKQNPRVNHVEDRFQGYTEHNEDKFHGMGMATSPKRSLHQGKHSIQGLGFRVRTVGFSKADQIEDT